MNSFVITHRMAYYETSPGNEVVTNQQDDCVKVLLST
jgi:hypothetical protein